ncbi:hypothetical protein Esti_004514 [Eimeria stiedai]
MPATAGWVKMPQSNRVAVSASLRTHAIWTDSVGYDPYAPEKQEQSAEADALKDKAKELLTLARLTGTLSTHTPGACSKCGQVGHLSFQCRNDVTLAVSKEQTVAFTSVLKQKEEEEDDERLRRALGIGSDDEAPGGPRFVGKRRRSASSSSSSSSDDSKRKKRKKKHKKHKKEKKHKHKEKKCGFC